MNGAEPTRTVWRVEIDGEACSLCEACVQGCSVGALFLRRREASLEILFDYRNCDGCSGQTFCETNCPEKAVTVGQAARHELPDEPVSLIIGQLQNCARCGSAFMPERKLTTLLGKQKISPKSVQAFCPECRRLHLMDTLLKTTGQP